MSFLQKIVRFLNVREEGSVATLSAILLPLIVGTAGYAVEFGYASESKAALQRAADSAALATAKQLVALGDSPTTLASIARAMSEANLGDEGTGLEKLKVTAKALDDGIGVQVDLSWHRPAIFGKLVNNTHPWVEASATAETIGKQKICILTLDRDDTTGLNMQHGSVIDAEGCSLLVNAGGERSVTIMQSAYINSSDVCMSGGYRGSPDRFKEEPVTDCPPYDDPLAERVVKASTVCDHPDRIEFDDSTDAVALGYETRDVDGLEAIVLTPGVYCGGIGVTGNVRIAFDPGEYVIKDGNMEFLDNTAAYGKGVSFQFTGKFATFAFEGNADVEFHAPETGPLAGIIFYENPNEPAKTNSVHLIESPNVRKLIGTVYLPLSTVYVDTATEVAAESAFTILVTKSLDMLKRPHIVLNTDYGATKVPVPDGFVRASGSARLVN